MGQIFGGCPAQLERVRRIFGPRLVRDGDRATTRSRHLEDVRALLPFRNAVTVHGPAEVRSHLRVLAAELSRHYAR